MGKWYKIGFQDALDGLCDPPMQPGHRSYASYMEGHADGDSHLSREAAADFETEDGWLRQAEGR